LRKGTLKVYPPRCKCCSSPNAAATRSKLEQDDASTVARYGFSTLKSNIASVDFKSRHIPLKIDYPPWFGIDPRHKMLHQFKIFKKPGKIKFWEMYVSVVFRTEA